MTSEMVKVQSPSNVVLSNILRLQQHLLHLAT
jgi:hypothetical protein